MTRRVIKKTSAEYKYGDKVRIVCAGRFNGETGTVIGTTDLNMDHRVIVRRDKLARIKKAIIGFHRIDLKLIKSSTSCSS